MELLDESGEIRATAFNDEVDKYYDMIEVRKKLAFHYVKTVNCGSPMTALICMSRILIASLEKLVIKDSFF